MASLKIKGGGKLQGEIIPQGAKNEAMQILCACLLTDEKVTIHNLPDILDINNLIALLEGMGVLWLPWDCFVLLWLLLDKKASWSKRLTVFWFLWEPYLR